MSTTYSAQIYKSPQKFLDACGSSLLATRDAPANLPLASTFRLASERPGQDSDDSTWISLTMTRKDGSSALFAITAVGVYPCVLASSVDPAQLELAERVEAMGKLATELRTAGLLPTRVSALVGPRVLAEPFADAWAELNGIGRKEQPLLHMFLSFVTPDTLRPFTKEISGVVVGPAQESNVDELGRMFEAFTAGRSHPMSKEAARGYAATLVQSGQLVSGLVNGRLAGLTTATRPSPGVRAISTVWTDEFARGKGLAEAMVREACRM